MALTKPLNYIRTQMNLLSYNEWEDSFNVENIPSSILDEAYHVEVGLITSQAANHHAHQFTFPVILRVFLKGYLNPKAAVDDALARGDDILESLLLPANRLGQAQDIKDVIPSSIQVLPLSATNDNAVILQMEMNFNLYDYF